MFSFMLLKDFINEKMVMDRLKIDLDDLDDNNFKSCFARSMALNSSQRKYTKTKQNKDENIKEKMSCNQIKEITTTTADVNSLRKDCTIIEDSSRRCLPGSNNSSRRGSLCSSRISETPVESIVYQSQIDTLQWQLKQIKASRDMYKAVMKQMITFLEKTHRSLDMLSTRLSHTRIVSRSRSEHQVSQLDTLNETTVNSTPNVDYANFRDFTWRRQKKQEISLDEVPPEKLSQEAFRLLRTAKSLLNTEEPDLTQLNDAPDDDVEFMAQLAKEFPRVRENNSNRASTSYSISPKLIKPDKECKISVAIKRNLSLQHTEHTVKDDTDQSLDGTIIFENNCVMSSTVNEKFDETLCKEKIQEKVKYEKSNSPPSSNVGSTEDESGFSSMNSYQEIGLPINGLDDVTYKDILIRNAELNNHKNYRKSEYLNKDDDIQSVDEIKLWQKSEHVATHRRWSSTPVDVPTEHPLKVLWV